MQVETVENQLRLVGLHLAQVEDFAHELRTPLTLIAGPTEQLLEDPTVKAPHRSMLEMIPVSYTHLDVYKRQPVYLIARSACVAL